MNLVVGLAACRGDPGGRGGPDPVEPVDSAVPAEPLDGFAFPTDPGAIARERIGVDHDLVVQPYDVVGRTTSADYLGRTFPHCFDEHHGTDFILDGGFPAMDAGSAPVRAAADGVVTLVIDDRYDRCHASGSGVSCDGYPIEKNEITLRHDRPIAGRAGLQSRYWHLMTDSAEVEVGDFVVCGQVLARIGSSGNSSFPHLHFQVEDADGNWVDPYVDAATDARSLWAEQGEDWALPGTTCPR
jgi:murein DD-endopeptidase MepM/ murein hydrolase activator NlpD